jgi:hypothetical protein
MFNIQCDVDCNTLKPSSQGGGNQQESGEEEEQGDGQGGRRLAYTQCEGAKQVKGYNCVVVGDNCALKSLCELEEDTKKCETHTELTDKKCVKEGSNCKLVSASTDSSNILNIFKITFILLFIFTIL